MNRQLCTRISKLEVHWRTEQCRRLDRMSEEALAAKVGPGTLEVLDELELTELNLVAQGHTQALQRFWQRLAEWQEQH